MAVQIPNAGNLYDPTANIDDGSCFTGEVGCMDPNSYNYCVTCIVDDPGSCEDFVYGCTDATVRLITYDPSMLIQMMVVVFLL